MEVEAEEASGEDEEDSEEEGGRPIRNKQHESQYYGEQELAKRQRGIDRNFIQGMEERYKDIGQDE